MYLRTCLLSWFPVQILNHIFALPTTLCFTCLLHTFLCQVEEIRDNVFNN